LVDKLAARVLEACDGRRTSGEAIRAATGANVSPRAALAFFDSLRGRNLVQFG
jgi:hypothetical protein